MCAGAIFWSGIGRVVFSLSSATLGTIVSDETGDWTLAMSCRDVFAHGGRAVDVSGPLLEYRGHGSCTTVSGPEAERAADAAQVVPTGDDRAR